MFDDDELIIVHNVNGNADEYETDKTEVTKGDVVVVAVVDVSEAMVVSIIIIRPMITNNRYRT